MQSCICSDVMASFEESLEARGCAFDQFQDGE